MAELPVLPVITAALIADTVHMTAEQFGAYVRILLAMWAHGAELKDNDSELARIAGVTVKRWHIIRDVVLEPVNCTDGMLHQKRLSATWNEVQKLRVKRTGAANERWHRERLRDAHAYANGVQKNAHAMQLKLKDKTTTTSVGTAREGSPMEPGREAVAQPDDLQTLIQRKGWVS